MTSSASTEKDVEMLEPLVSKTPDELESSPSEERKLEESKPTIDYRKAVNASLLYCFCSVSMVLANKSLASRYVNGLITNNCAVSKQTTNLGFILSMIVVTTILSMVISISYLLYSKPLLQLLV